MKDRQPDSENGQTSVPSPIADEITERVDAWHEGLERRRQAEGVWTTGSDGEPQWLPPDDGPGDPVEPAND